MRSIRWKLTLAFFLLAAITLALTGSLLIITTGFLARQIETDTLRETAGDLLPRMQSMLQFEEDPERIDDFIRMAESLGNIDLRFVGPDGEVDAATLFADRIRREAVPGVPRMRPPVHPDLGEFIDRLLIEDTGRILDRTDQDAPTGTIRFGAISGPGKSYFEISDRADLSGQLIRLTLLGFLVSAVVTLGASTLIGLAVGSNLTRPIEQLTDTVATMQEGNLAARATVTTGDEIGVLGQRFNEMADDLGRTIETLREERDALRGFLADASHELRTPLTALTTFVELLRNEGVADDQVEILVEMQEQTRRMEHTVADLLLLSRLDGGLTELDRQPVSVGELVKSAWATAAASVGDRIAFTLTDQSDPTVQLVCDRDRIVTLFENLFSNSLNALGESGRVECTIRDTGTHRQFRVVDTGGGISEIDLPRVFDRFFRSGSNRTKGTGLGLSIAHSIVRMHGGSIAARSPVAGQAAGTEMIVHLPLPG